MGIPIENSTTIRGRPKRLITCWELRMAKMEVIDGSAGTDLVQYEIPDLQDDLELDFIDSDNLEELEEGIQKIGLASDLLALVQGVAILKVENHGLWRQAGFDNLRAYRIAQSDRLKIPRSTLSTRRGIAQAWLDNRKALGNVDLSGHVQKLVFLPEAIENYGRREAISHFKNDTFREFKAWVRPREEEEVLPDVDIQVHEDKIVLEGKGILEFSAKVPAKEREFVADVLRAAYRERKGNLHPYVIGLYEASQGKILERLWRDYLKGK